MKMWDTDEYTKMQHQEELFQASCQTINSLRGSIKDIIDLAKRINDGEVTDESIDRAADILFGEHV